MRQIDQCIHNQQIQSHVLKPSCLTLEINEFRCYEAKIEECEKSTGGSSQKYPGFNSRWLPGFFTLLYSRLITSKLIYQSQVHCK